MSFVHWIGQMKTGPKKTLSPRVCLMASVAIPALVCSGCQTFMTEDEYQAKMAHESAEQHPYIIGLQPGWYGTWKP
jgi:hypothetical protein